MLLDNRPLSQVIYMPPPQVAIFQPHHVRQWPQAVLYDCLLPMRPTPQVSGPDHLSCLKLPQLSMLVMMLFLFTLLLSDPRCYVRCQQVQSHAELPSHKQCARRHTRGSVWCGPVAQQEGGQCVLQRYSNAASRPQCLFNHAFSCSITSGMVWCNPAVSNAIPLHKQLKLAGAELGPIVRH